MKNRRLALENLGNLVSNGGGFDLFVRESSRNLSFASPFLGVRLAHNTSDPNSENDPPGDQYGLNGRFNPSMAIIIVVLLSAFFFMGFFSIYVRRCAGEDSNLGNSRRRDSRRAPRRRDEATHGLDRAVIESFPVFTYDLVKGLKAQTKETLECAVCLNEFEDDEELRLLPKCSHAFHPECIDMWLSSHTTCPVCRINLAPTDDDNPTGIGYGIIEAPEITPPEEITVVVDEARRNGSVRRGNDVQTPVALESADSQDQDSVGVMGFNRPKKLRRSHSTGHSLVRLRKDSDQSATEWYIYTAEGLTPGLHRNCSLTARPHSRSKSRIALSKQDSLRRADSCSGDAETSSSSVSGRRWYERGLRSERISISSLNPSSFLRTYSEHRAPNSYSRRQGSSADFFGSQQERKPYLPSLKNTLKRLTGRERELTDNSQNGRGSSRGIVDESGDSITNVYESRLGI